MTHATTRLGFTLRLAAASLIGVAFGAACHRYLAAPQWRPVESVLTTLTEAFLRLIRMIVAPLVFASLVPALAGMGGARETSRVALRTLAWFLAASCLSLLIGLAMAQWLQPGAGIHAGALPQAGPGDAALAPGIDGFMQHLVPRSIVEAMATNEILQVVVFSLFFGAATAALKEQTRTLVQIIEQLAAVLFKITDYVMRTAPIAIFAALATVVGTQGLGIVGAYARFVGGFYLALGLLWAALILALLGVVGRSGLRILSAIREPVWLAFATASSEVAYPRLLERLVDAGVTRRIASFVVPLGYSFNLDGAMMYCSFAILFIAQAYGVTLTPAQLWLLFGLLIVTTKGIAGVPRAAIAVVAISLHDLGLPDSGVALVLAVDHLLDMGRTATNVLGNAVASTVMDHFESSTRSS